MKEAQLRDEPGRAARESGRAVCTQQGELPFPAQWDPSPGLCRQNRPAPRGTVVLVSAALTHLWASWCPEVRVSASPMETPGSAGTLLVEGRRHSWGEAQPRPPVTLGSAFLWQPVPGGLRGASAHVYRSGHVPVETRVARSRHTEPVPFLCVPEQRVAHFLSLLFCSPFCESCLSGSSSVTSCSASQPQGLALLPLADGDAGCTWQSALPRVCPLIQDVARPCVPGTLRGPQGTGSSVHTAVRE